MSHVSRLIEQAERIAQDNDQQRMQFVHPDAQVQWISLLFLGQIGQLRDARERLEGLKNSYGLRPAFTIQPTDRTGAGAVEPIRTHRDDDLVLQPQSACCIRRQQSGGKHWPADREHADLSAG